MGKKSKKARGTDSGLMPRQQRREITELVNSLLDKCSQPASGGTKDWQDYVEIHQMVEKIREKQTGFTLENINREEHIDEFTSWLKDNDVCVDAVSIHKFEEGGFGLKAMNNIKEAECFLNIPKKLMMTSETARKSVLGPIIEQDRILQAMPNVMLALHLLCERHKKDSFWQPYIKILPDAYTTTLYFCPDELNQLKGSPVFYDALSQYRNIARQYAYFYRLFQGMSDATGVGKLPFHNSFCFDDYRWAVSSVMTRQNQIPVSAGEVSTALIPMWDMCNHQNGQISTGYSLEKGCSECFALKDFNKGDQVFIFYGARSNADLLVHNGFVYPPNQYDRMAIKLGISKNDSMFAMKAEVLARVGLLPSRIFHLDCGSNPINHDLLSYLRVFSMSEDELKDRLTGQRAIDLISMLNELEFIVSMENETKAWTFLTTRASLLLKAYPTSIAEDEKVLKTELSDASQLAIQLRLQEKRLLQNAIDFANGQLQEVQAGSKKVATVEKTAEDAEVPSSVSEERIKTETLSIDEMIDKLAVGSIGAPTSTDYKQQSISNGDVDAVQNGCCCLEEKTIDDTVVQTASSDVSCEGDIAQVSSDSAAVVKSPEADINTKCQTPSCRSEQTSGATINQTSVCKADQTDQNSGTNHSDCCQTETSSVFYTH